MRIALAQIDTTVGDLTGNRALIADAYRAAAARGAEVVLFPELALPGYPPMDLLLRGDFVEACAGSLDKLAREITGPPAIVGTVRRNAAARGRLLHNTAALLARGQVESFHDKVLLPNYDVFDEERYFEPGGAVAPAAIAGRRVGIAICEDFWSGAKALRMRYARDPVRELRAAGAEIFLCPSASPYHAARPAEREQVFQAVAREHDASIAVANLVGGNTELIFDGGSFLVTRAGVAAEAARFAPDLLIVESGGARGAAAARPRGAPAAESAADEMAQALVLGIRDYYRKCGFKSAVLGLSGGIDSAVAAVLACDALGKDAVHGVAMPSRYSSEGSLRDAKALAANLAIDLRVVSIEPLFTAALESLRPVFGDAPPDTAEENLQARIRGLLLMALSNRFGGLVIATGNKSELAVGYCTLYGDMCGGLAPLGDVSKMDVYRIAALPRYRSSIPQASVDKPPSAELRPNQTDQDTLPPYPLLDEILRLYVEEERSVAEIISRGFEEGVVEQTARMVEWSEYKRRQAPPVLRVTSKAFGIGRRMPIARSMGE
ncbi:MAG: NAD+ synthase [Planctomycetes bacterium]|nr:NAD+ synthase [Planctomycetota bacterium]